MHIPTPPAAARLSRYANAPENRGIFRAVDAARRGRLADDPLWPPDVFLPLEAAGALLLDRHPGFASRRDALGDFARAGAELQIFSAWRVTKGIYRFDEDLAAALMATPITGEIPADALRRLPEWCVYVETPGLLTGLVGGGETPVHGIFATLDQPPEGPPLLVLGVDAADIDRLPITHVHLGHSLADSLAATEREWQVGLDRGMVSEWHAGWTKAAGALFPKILPLLLYLCSEAPEIEGPGRPGNPAPRRIKRDWQLIAAARSRTWDVGVRIGAALRKGAAARDSGLQAGGTAHASPRPHIRRAHWHTYRTGKGRVDSALRWIPPVAVGVDDPDDLPATIHPVEPERRADGR